MKRNSERGVALVITLIMLSLVTFMAVVFLAISRREKASVSTIGDITTARLMADTAYARAVSEVVARVMTSTNPYDYDLIVSTNYYNPAGFQPGVASRLNVNYERAAGLANWIQNIANLQYDARAPVFISTNLLVRRGNESPRTNEFRFWLDLNRNGLFEPTGLLVEIDRKGAGQVTNYVVGDPQWIGILERPDLPHSETNRFIGRIAYLVVPAGKALDLNFMHNYAKRLRTDMSVDSYFRHQNVGSYEMNLAGFLQNLNTNSWLPQDYVYNTSLANQSSGAAFEDARALLKHRYQGSLAGISSAQQLFNFAQPTINPFTTNHIDFYASGSFSNNPALPWAGSYNTNGFYDIQELFNTNNSSLGFVRRLMSRSTNVLAPAYDRYTFYRMLGQLNTDSRSPDSNKLYGSDFQLHYTNRMHLAYANVVPNGQTNFFPWHLNTYTRTAFFTNAADRLLRANLDLITWTNRARFVGTNFMMGLTPVRNIFSATNIQLAHIDAGRSTTLPFYLTNNEYTPAVRRLLQVAANIQDATSSDRFGTTNEYPSVYRPLFMRTSTNLVITGFIEETNALFLNFPWMTIDEVMALPPQSPKFPRNRVIQGVNLYGVAPIIGAKKGLPNFNKFVMQTVADISRRLEIRKTTPQGHPTATNQMYVIGVSNRFGIEGWNSYQQDFNHNLELRVASESTLALHHRLEGSNTNLPPQFAFWSVNTSTQTNHWAGWSNLTSQASFIVPVDTNVASIPSSIYLTKEGRLLPHTTNVFENSFRVPQWLLRITNRLQYILIDRSAKPVPRIIDLVNIDKLTTELDLTGSLTGNTNAGGGGIFSDKNKGGKASLGDNDMWNPQHSATGLDSPSLGVLNQISVSKGTPFVGEGTWADPAGGGGQMQTKDAAIRTFTRFLEGQLTNLTMQAPFTPSRRLYRRTSWEANDPLVHYTAEDLTEPVVQGSTNQTVQAIPFNFPLARDAMLRQLNPRYRPWGGNPNKETSHDTTAYALTLKDPLIRRSDDWHFPTNQFPNLGWLGRVHRGTPWQTIYLKAGLDPRISADRRTGQGQPLDLDTWAKWSGSIDTHPTNDWRILDLFTAAPNENASRGLLSVNQTNIAAWSAVLSGVSVLTNAYSDAAVGAQRVPQYREVLIHPNSPQLVSIVAGINRAHAQAPNRTFQTLGDVLSAPELTVLSPYLNLSQRQIEEGIDDDTYERIPQQILSLLKTDEPRLVVYAFGQSLKPADRSLVTLTTVNPPIFNICTNYQITGEFATKTVVRIDDMPPERIARTANSPMAQKKRAVVESFTVLQPD